MLLWLTGLWATHVCRELSHLSALGRHAVLDERPTMAVHEEAVGVAQVTRSAQKLRAEQM